MAASYFARSGRAAHEGVDCAKHFAQSPPSDLKAKDLTGQVISGPTFASAQTIAEAGADIIAVVCTTDDLLSRSVMWRR